MSTLPSNALLVGVPSKGRLQENAHAFFARAGMSLVQPRGGRDYRGTIPELEGVEIVYLSAAEITGQLAQGGLHFGVTGEDLLREIIADADERVLLIDGLGFGHANVVVAVPQAWIDVRTMHDLDDVTTAFHAKHDRRMRVATKYVHLTRTFFARHGISDYRIVESLGATEGAPATGAAELIVDITTTGATLAANGLKVLDDGVMLRSQANLVASLAANWGERERAAARALLDRVAAERQARTMREVRARFPGADAEMVAEAKGRFGVQAPLGGPTSSGMLTLLCAPDRVHELAIFLREAGAETVMVASPEYVFARENSLYDALVKRLGRKG
jgi:ATP phosphoribosyltransferase